MGKYNDKRWIGKKFGMLTVLRPVHVTTIQGNNEWHWEMKCDCGNKKVYRPYPVIKGKIVSCGCWREQGKQVPKRHRESHTRLHNIW